MPIRWRLTIFYTATMLVIAAFLLLILLAVSLRAVSGTVEDYSRVRAQDIARYLSTGATLTNEETEALVDGNEYISVRDASGRITAQSVDLAQSMRLLSDDDRDEPWIRALAEGHGVGHDAPRELYVYAAPFSVNGQPAGVVEVWKSSDETGEALVPFDRIVVLIIPLAMILAIVGAYFQARSALRPVDAITQAAREITEGDLSKRLPVTNATDELGRLASTFNGVLARLETAFAAKEETLAAQRRFVADASHELRTPLTSILGYARMLKQWGLDDPATARESVAAMEQQAARMVDLAEGMLSLARGDEELRLERGWHDLAAVAAESFAAAKAAANGRVGMFYRPPRAPVMARFDRGKVEQVATILLDNAVKYTPAGGTVTLEVAADATGSTLSVTDTGSGIAPDHLPHIFERFYRADPARAAGGTGLGLAIAGQIAARHGGRIDVASRLGRRSRFTLWLPKSGET
jgi:signal transduction histidine kinase